jgi:predicted naringenin-chalcone synthase
MFFTGLGTAVPANRYTQAQCWDAVQRAPQFAGLDARARWTLQRVLLNDNGISTRHLAVDALEEGFEVDPDTLHRRFARHAPELAAAAAAAALRQADLQPREVDALLISTCTGYLCPGLTSYVGERLGLRQDIVGLDLVGQGCAAALPNLRAAEALIDSGRCNAVLSICVEVCSAAFYIDNDPGVLISACLFGDGAGAAVLAARPKPRGRRVEWKRAWSSIEPAERDTLRFEQRGGLLRNILSPQVPKLAARHAGKLLERALSEERLARGDIRAWIWHAGGRNVLDRLREQLGLEDSDLERSARMLSEFGNVSSPFVYFVLDAALRDNAAGGKWWMSSFGAGFSCHGALLEVSP